MIGRNSKKSRRQVTHASSVISHAGFQAVSARHTALGRTGKMPVLRLGRPVQTKAISLLDSNFHEFANELLVAFENDNLVRARSAH
jgi:hypothetical protein